MHPLVTCLTLAAITFGQATTSQPAAATHAAHHDHPTPPPYAAPPPAPAPALDPDYTDSRGVFALCVAVPVFVILIAVGCTWCPQPCYVRYAGADARQQDPGAFLQYVRITHTEGPDAPTAVRGGEGRPPATAPVWAPQWGGPSGGQSSACM